MIFMKISVFGHSPRALGKHRERANGDGSTTSPISNANGTVVSNSESDAVGSTNYGASRLIF